MSGFDYYTIIGRDPGLFRGHVGNTLKNAGLSRDLWDFYVIIYHNENIPQEITDELVAICEENDIHYVLHHEDPSVPFINRLYVAWNKGYDLGKRDLVFRGGSDQVWNPSAFQNLWNAWESVPHNAILQAQTVESPLAGLSRHFMKDFGTTYDSFKEEEFEKFCEQISQPGLYSIHEALAEWGHPTHFNSSLGFPHNRTDGCSWLQSRKLFKQHGPMPPIRGGITGDVLIHDAYERAGIPNFLVGDCITYHFVRGESR